MRERERLGLERYEKVLAPCEGRCAPARQREGRTAVKGGLEGVLGEKGELKVLVTWREGMGVLCELTGELHELVDVVHRRRVRSEAKDQNRFR